MCLNEVFRPEYLSEYFEISTFAANCGMPRVSSPLPPFQGGRFAPGYPISLKWVPGQEKRIKLKLSRITSPFEGGGGMTHPSTNQPQSPIPNNPITTTHGLATHLPGLRFLSPKPPVRHIPHRRCAAPCRHGHWQPYR